MTFTEIQTQFSLCKSWEERYRLLIKLSRELPTPSPEVLEKLPEIHGCESRLWFQFQASPRAIQAYSDARLMQGILAIVIAYVNESPDEILKQIDLQAVFSELNLAKNLTSTRLNGLSHIEKIIRESEFSH